MKTIIALFGPSNHGKTSTIKSISKHLDVLFANGKVNSERKINDRDDISEIWKIHGKTVVLESMGDPKSELETRLEKLMKHSSPDVLVTACRTRGETTDALLKICNDFQCEIVWTSSYLNFNNNSSTPKVLNNFKAKHLTDLILNHLLITS